MDNTVPVERILAAVAAKAAADGDLAWTAQLAEQMRQLQEAEAGAGGTGEWLVPRLADTLADTFRPVADEPVAESVEEIETEERDS